MTNLPISAELASTLLQIADDENLPLEHVLRSMIKVYHAQGVTHEVEARLRQLPGVIPPLSDEAAPMTDTERIALAKRVGKGGDLSSWVIQERREGY